VCRLQDWQQHRQLFPRNNEPCKKVIKRPGNHLWFPGRFVVFFISRELIDMDDLIFYEVAMEKRDDDVYLVTGNQKHYPIRDFIVTPAEMMEIIENTEKI